MSWFATTGSVNVLNAAIESKVGALFWNTAELIANDEAAHPAYAFQSQQPISLIRYCSVYGVRR